MNWRNEMRNCDCGVKFRPKREAQRYCSARCGSAERMARQRSRNRSEGKPRSAPPCASEWARLRPKRKCLGGQHAAGQVRGAVCTNSESKKGGGVGLSEGGRGN